MKELFISFSYPDGFGNCVLHDFDKFNTEVCGELENGRISSYIIRTIEKYIGDEKDIRDVVVVNFQWLEG